MKKDEIITKKWKKKLRKIYICSRTTNHMKSFLKYYYSAGKYLNFMDEDISKNKYSAKKSQ